jgi:hypothetical protein
MSCSPLIQTVSRSEFSTALATHPRATLEKKKPASTSAAVVSRKLIWVGSSVSL